MTSAGAAEATAYCRHVLPRVSRTFAINIEMLAPSLRDTVRVGYLLCRAADALEDSWPGEPEEIAKRFERFTRAVEGDDLQGSALAAAAAALEDPRDDIGLLSELPLVLHALATRPETDRATVRTCVSTMAAGMSRYAGRAAARPPEACYLDDESELFDYCWVVAGCVGVMLTQLFQQRLAGSSDPARERRRELAPRVGEALQLTNILLDLPQDLRRGRCYLPAAWLSERGLSPRDFLGAPRPDGREVAARLETLAHAALDRVPEYVDTIPSRHLRYRLFCLWPAMWARASLQLVHGDAGFPFRPGRARLTRAALWGSAARSLVLAHSRDGVRRLLAGA